MIICNSEVNEMQRYTKQQVNRLKLLRFDTLESLTARYGIILKAGFRDRDRVLKAKEKIDHIRQKYGRESQKTNSVKIIRKWREGR